MAVECVGALVCVCTLISANALSIRLFDFSGLGFGFKVNLF